MFPGIKPLFPKQEAGPWALVCQALLLNIFCEYGLNCKGNEEVALVQITPNQNTPPLSEIVTPQISRSRWLEGHRSGNPKGRTQA